MRSLNSSLPSSTPHSHKSQSPEQLLQAFKSAALSVTNLYKSAVADHSDTRQQGYQDAMEDLLIFLDKENLGLMDGEGWKVRQWATERYNRIPGTATLSDNEEENCEDENQARTSSPVRQQNQDVSHHARHPSPTRREPSEQATAPETQPEKQGNTATNPPIFTFTAAPPAILHDTDMYNAEQQAGGTMSEQGNGSQASTRVTETPIRVEVHGKSSKTPHRHGGGSRHGQRSTTRDIHVTGGTKRKLQFPDFFDLSNLGSGQGKDATGGNSKRGRFV